MTQATKSKKRKKNPVTVVGLCVFALSSMYGLVTGRIGMSGYNLVGDYARTVSAIMLALTALGFWMYLKKE